ncbi:sensor histidine kinase, partial [Pedobacter sp. ASV12]|uniref:sensor histidine kinase n=1 Tax=Pedobacter sp. ASV12 TaxID=2795120 RepID=UPI0018EDE3C4
VVVRRQRQMCIRDRACLSLFFTRFAFDSIANQYQVENHNLKLQMEALKVQLQPHFLFNTLNSIYGMAMMKRKEAPEMILRLSDMMRYVLYDCRHDKVELQKDVEFLQNYLEMERMRYPNASIAFELKNLDGHLKIAPMLFIQFLENSFKHGAARVQEQGFIRGYLQGNGNELTFSLSNDVMKQLTSEERYGGVGIANV